MLNKFIKYIGYWNRLIPIGYNSQHMLYKNIHYKKNGILIRKIERCVEISNLYDDSYVLLEYLIETNFAYATNNTFVFNKEDNCIEVFDIYKHDYIFAIKPEDFGNKSIMKEKYDLYFQKYKIIYVFENTMDTLKELYFNKMMTIVTE